jgi:hypothetical protein
MDILAPTRGSAAATGWLSPKTEVDGQDPPTAVEPMMMTCVLVSYCYKTASPVATEVLALSSKDKEQRGERYPYAVLIPIATQISSRF